jgi:serine/threonine protein kinase
MCTAQDFIRRLLEADPTRRMSLTEALRHPWLDSSAESAGGASQPSALARYPIDRSLSDVSELSELPEEDDHGGANGDASMISALPSSSDMLGVQGLNINSPEKARARRPLERRSKVLARELAAEAEAHPSPEAEAEAEAAEPAASASTPPTSNRNSGTGGKRRRPESSSGGGSPGDAAMGGESADSDEAEMDVDPQPPASKRGRRSQSKEQQAPGMPPTVKNGNGNGSGRVTRSKAAGPAGVQRR